MVDTFNTDFGETSVNTSYSNAVSALFACNRRGICPEGWHIPSDAEWTTLTDYVSVNFACEDNSANNAKALASETDDWNDNASGECYSGDQSVKPNNASGFSAVPAGYWDDRFGSAGSHAYFWSSTEYGTSFAWYRRLYYSYAGVGRIGIFRNLGFSVLCLRD